MNEDALLKTIDRIREALESGTSMHAWNQLDFDESPVWAERLLAQIAIAVGDDEIVFISGNSVPDGADRRLRGSVVAITARTLVRATFSAWREANSAYVQTESSVDIVSREAITKVSVVSVRLKGRREEWQPSARISLSIDATCGLGVTALELPLQERQESAELVALAHTLVGGATGL